MLRGAIAAAVTPLADGGASLDEEAFAPLVLAEMELGVRGVPVREDVRAPLRGLIDPERSIALEAARTVGVLGS